MPRLNSSVVERLNNRSQLTPSGCRIWIGPKHDAMGYGRMSVGGVMRYVHRLAWTEANGPIPDGLVLRHWCDTPSCINIDHLELGTQQENVSDMFSRGRADRSGGRNNSARLTDMQVREMRRLSNAGVRGTELARKFNVSQSQVSNIINYRKWRDS